MGAPAGGCQSSLRVWGASCSCNSVHSVGCLWENVGRGVGIDGTGLPSTLGDWPDSTKRITLMCKLRGIRPYNLRRNKNKAKTSKTCFHFSQKSWDLMGYFCTSADGTISCVSNLFRQYLCRNFTKLKSWWESLFSQIPLIFPRFPKKTVDAHKFPWHP